jgi:hypothetical protein
MENSTIVFLGMAFSLEFLISYALSVFTLILFCMEKFNKPTNASDDNFVARLVPKHFDNGPKKTKAFAIYCGLMLAVFSALCLLGHAGIKAYLGPGSATDLLNADRSAQFIPLLLLTIFTGFSTEYPLLNIVEKKTRQFTHHLIGIPIGIQRIAEELERSEFSEGLLSPEEKTKITSKYKELTSEDLTSIDSLYSFVSPDRILVRRWLRLNFLLDKLNAGASRLPRQFNKEIFREYQSAGKKAHAIKDSITDEDIRSIITDENTSKKLRRVDELSAQLKSALDIVYALISAAGIESISHHGKDSEIVKYFRLDYRGVQQINGTDIFIYATGISSLFVLLVTFFAPKAMDYFSILTDQGIPTSAADTTFWAISTLAIHGSACLAAWRYRLYRGDKWKPASILRGDIPGLQHCLALGWSWIFSTFAYLIALWFTSFMPLLPSYTFELTESSKHSAIIGLIGLVTGYFFNNSLDIVLLKCGKTRICAQPIIQGLSTATATGFVMGILQASAPATEQISNGLIYYAVIISFFAGAIIGALVTFSARSKLQERQSSESAPDLVNA